MSAVSLGHKSKGRHYDIDGFISELLASRKFDDLAEKLAEKAAYKIMHIDTAPAAIQRATDDNEVNNSTESTQKINQNQSYINKIEKNQMNNVKLRKEFTGKINPQAVINTTISLSENLQLKYKYLKKNALEKRVKSNQKPLSKNDTEEEPSKNNTTLGPADFKYLNKTEEPISNENVTEKNQNNTEKQSIGENKRSQDDTKDDDRKKDPNKNCELNENCHSGTDGSSTKRDHSLEEVRPGNEMRIFREAQNSGLEEKGIVEQEASQVNNGLREDKPSSLDEENQKHLARFDEKNIKEVENPEGEPENRATREINEDKNVIAQFRAHEDSIEDNKVTFDYKPHVGVYRTRASDDRGDVRSKEHSPEDQRHKEQSSEDQSSKEQSGEDPNSSKLKPVIREEGDKLYAYVRAPEYEDYHEKLAKWRKHHPENPADFMK